jgi:site-specific recombinase XerD
MARSGDGIYKRGQTWYLDTRINGTRYVRKLGKGISKTVARELAGVKRTEILKAEAGIAPKKRKDITFDKAAEEFLKAFENTDRPHMYRCFKSQVKNLKTVFSGKRLSEINRFLIEKYKQARFKDDARVAVNRELSCLRNIFNRCMEGDHPKYEGANPLSGFMKKYRMQKESTEPKPRYLTQQEEPALLAQARGATRSIILAGIYAGLRIESEALTLEKTEVDLIRRSVTVTAAKAKNRKERRVPINDVLFQVLKAEMARSQSQWVFTKKDLKSPYHSIRTAFETAVRNAKLSDDVTPHVTFATRLVQAGVDLRTVQQLGGWSSLAMVQRYSSSDEDRKMEAVQRLAISQHVSQQSESEGSGTKLQVVAAS